MYLPIPQRPDCASAWLNAATTVNQLSNHEAYNVIIDIEDPVANSALNNPVVSLVNDFLVTREKSIECVANTIFPQALYHLHGAPQFIDVFHQRILPKVRKKERWSGYYFERMTNVPTQDGKSLNQLWNIVERMRNEKNHALNKYELSLFDAERDTDNSPYGGQCLSFLSFKILPTEPKKTLVLTALYRNHYYTEKLLGNLIGLGRLMAFVARETGANVGPLTVISTHAFVDNPKASRKEISSLLEACSQAEAMRLKAA